MAELYYNQLSDGNRSKIQFVLLNDDTAVDDMGRLKAAAKFNGKELPAVQDDNKSTLMNALSNNNDYPKDDMALVDKNGRMIKYFTNAQSSMSNRQSNNVRSMVMEVVRDGYKNPCGGGDDGKQGGDGKGKGEMSPLDELKAHCMLSKDTCAACKGRMKRGACALKKRLKCKMMMTEELCKKAKCSYKAPKRGKKAKCKGRGIF